MSDVYYKVQWLDPQCAWADVNTDRYPSYVKAVEQFGYELARDPGSEHRIVKYVSEVVSEAGGEG
jgi:hypothetical protein